MVSKTSTIRNLRLNINKKTAFLFLIAIGLLIGFLMKNVQLSRWKFKYFQLNLWQLKTNKHALLINDNLQCTCRFNKSAPEVTSYLNSSCGDWATSRGPGQQVVSYSIYGASNSYFNGIAKNADLIAQYYPGWVMRVYYHFDLPKVDAQAQLCPLWCRYPHLDLCSIEHLPAPLFNLHALHPMMWRFLVFGDPLVSRFISRDLDSIITERELSAVNEWIASGKTFHFMHDHYHHLAPVMGGMWGSVNTNLTLATSIRQSLINEGNNNRTGYSEDQTALAKVLIPIAEANQDYVNHNSYTCKLPSPKKSHPWPTQRNSSYEFVGCAFFRFPCKLVKKCPTECRPLQHQDWDYC